jgi:alkylated DNA repair protein (DNA oxidative demethylase)
MSVQMVCLGWHWVPYRYTPTADDVDGAPVTPFPSWLGELGRRAIRDAFGDPALAAGYAPDVALVNRYADGARMGMHQDRDERRDDPVVSLSLGDSCTFRFGNTVNRGRPYTDIELASGDLFVFGEPARFAFHGVPRVDQGSGSADIGVSGERLNITMRVTGLTAA